MKITLCAPAKINLFLYVLQRRPDKYHNLQTLYHLLDLADELTFCSHDRNNHINYSGPVIENNLILRAAKALRKKTGTSLGAQIILNKHLPMGAGIGGGSSNCATTLLGLNTLWNTGLSIDELAEIGATLGADVPVFVRGHSAWGEGIGEILTPISLPSCWYLLITPPCHTKTPKIFMDPQLTRRKQGITIAGFDYQRCGNDCEAVAKRHYPDIETAMTWLNDYGFAKMTGTGSTVFAAFDTQAEAQQVANQAPAHFSALVAKGVNVSQAHTQLAEQSSYIGASPSGKAHGFDPCIPRFESWRPSHLLTQES